MSSKTEICNLTLSHLGQAKEIANVDTEQSQEASACRRFYETAIKATLGDHDWSFATEYYTLELVATAPNTEWSYSYRYPSSCLKLRRILSGYRQDTDKTRIPFKLAKDDAGILIFTDQESAQIEQTSKVDDPSFYTPQFIIAFSFRLAGYIAPRLTGGDPFKLKEEMLGQYAIELQTAKADDLDEGQLDKKPESEFVTGRK